MTRITSIRNKVYTKLGIQREFFQYTLSRFNGKNHIISAEHPIINPFFFPRMMRLFQKIPPPIPFRKKPENRTPPNKIKIQTVSFPQPSTNGAYKISRFKSSPWLSSRRRNGLFR